MAKIHFNKVVEGRPGPMETTNFPLNETDYNLHRGILSKALSNVENYATLLEAYYSYFDTFHSILVRSFGVSDRQDSKQLTVFENRAKLNACLTAFFNLVKLYSDNYSSEKGICFHTDNALSMEFKRLKNRLLNVNARCQ